MRHFLRCWCAGWAVVFAMVCSVRVAAQGSTNSTHRELIDEALRKSSLVESSKPFHLMMEIRPGRVLFPGHEATSDMTGSMEVFWAGPTRYKMVLSSPSFSQTKVVDGPLVEEHDEGDFYPRWLDNFVQAFLNPFPHVEEFRSLHAKVYGGGTMSLPGREPITMPRCIEKSDRPGGITEETSVARICFDAKRPWIASGLDFTRYVSFKDYRPFAGQQIPRTWENDIPENIFVEGTVTKLEPLSKKDEQQIHVTRPTPASEQIRTVFLSRQKIGEIVDTLPAYEWPAENTEALEGWMIVYVRTDRTGKIRESYWDSSDNYKLQDAGVRLALLAKLKPTVAGGVPVQVEGPLVLHFKTQRSAELAPSASR